MLKLLGPAVSVSLCIAAFLLPLDSIKDYGTVNALSMATAAVALTPRANA